MLQLGKLNRCQVLPSSAAGGYTQATLFLTIWLELDGQIQKLELRGLEGGRRETLVLMPTFNFL